MLDHEGLETENDALKLKVDDIKGQYQRNINILGIPEQEKGCKPTEFV